MQTPSIYGGCSLMIPTDRVGRRSLSPGARRCGNGAGWRRRQIRLRGAIRAFGAGEPHPTT